MSSSRRGRAASKRSSASGSTIPVPVFGPIASTMCKLPRRAMVRITLSVTSGAANENLRSEGKLGQPRGELVGHGWNGWELNDLDLAAGLAQIEQGANGTGHEAGKLTRQPQLTERPIAVRGEAARGHFQPPQITEGFYLPQAGGGHVRLDEDQFLQPGMMVPYFREPGIGHRRAAKVEGPQLPQRSQVLEARVGHTCALKPDFLQVSQHFQGLKIGVSNPLPAQADFHDRPGPRPSLTVYLGASFFKSRHSASNGFTVALAATVRARRG